MKYFFFTFFLLIASISFAQPPLYYFDKTRCQQQATLIQNYKKRPFVVPLKNLIPKQVLPSTVSYWQKENNEWIPWTPYQISNDTLKIDTTGLFLIVVFDAIDPRLVEIEITTNQLQIKSFIHCVLHH